MPQPVYLQSAHTYRITDAIVWGIPAAAYLQFFHTKEQDFEYSSANFDKTKRIITEIDRGTIERCTGLTKDQQIKIEKTLQLCLIIDVLHIDEEDENISVFIKHDNYFKFRTNPHWYVEQFEQNGASEVLDCGV